ncbi:MAG: hypothetical protein VZQ98_13180 [Bacteroidales bacterium]|nr:hypothetical protein [Bacteroidales bacterium]
MEMDGIKELLDKYNLITDKEYTVEDIKEQLPSTKNYFEQQYFEQKFFVEYSAYDKNIQCASIL